MVFTSGTEPPAGTASSEPPLYFLVPMSISRQLIDVWRAEVGAT